MIRTALVGILLLAGSFAWAEKPSEHPIRFNRDIRPILSNNCYQCHGFDEKQRQAGLRLDKRESAVAELPSGSQAIVPRDSEQSELLTRVTSDDEFLVMPPPETDKQLTTEQIDLLKRWIDQGAEYEGHWSFIAPRKPMLPKISQQDWPRNEIDHFILARLEEEGFSPAESADKRTLIRRVTLDLTGLPPRPEEVDAFLKDKRPDAYERLVDRLLASRRYGEHQARYWLDAARYGDTHGLHLDNYREIWPYRDWVIEAFNRNMPFDQFTVEQLAGDLLPKPSEDQLVATGFNRCNVTTSEGGSIAEEFYVRYAVDRVETTSTVWMGLTMGCAVCHDHKYDPISQREFYQMFAFFNNITENAMDGNKKDPKPVIPVMTAAHEQQQQEFEQEIAAARAAIRKQLASLDYVDPASKSNQRHEFIWIDDTTPPGAKPQGDSPWKFVTAEGHPVFRGQKATQRSANGRSQHFFTEANPPLVLGQGDTLFAYVYLDPNNPPRELMLQWNDGSWEHRATWGEDVIDWGKPNTASRVSMGKLPETGKWVRLEVEAAQVGLPAGSKINGWAFTQFDGTVYWDAAGIVTQTPQVGESQQPWETFAKTLPQDALPEAIHAVLKTPREQRTPEQSTQLKQFYLERYYSKTRDLFAESYQQIDKLQAELDALKQQLPTTLVMDERENPKPAFMLERGEYDRRRDQVQPGVPSIFPPLETDKRADRLDLARWLVSPQHPLTARVTVNRYWQQFFGTGIVKTSEDFGSQGDWPSHPELLDWLATEFVASGWDIKALHKQIVMSATYRQSAKPTPEKLQLDPNNRLLSRGPRFRLDAEVIRDCALFVSGLLVERVGGPSVKPYQPAGLWRGVGYSSSNTAVFKQDSGDALYRRSLYTFWKRTSPPPTMQIFDAPSREACTVRRSRTNTPLQALALMNDVQFVEAARHFAERILREGGKTPEARLQYGFLAVTSRLPSEKELDVLLAGYREHLAEYQRDPQAAEALLQVGDSPRNESLPAAEHAAWTIIANLLLNLNETITKG